MIEVYYQDDYVTLYHADSLKHPELWAGADVLVTDPPYGIKMRQKWSTGKTREERRANAQARKALGGTAYYGVPGDESTDARDAALAAWGDEKPALCFGTWRKPRPANTRQLLVWYKRHPLFARTPEKTHPWISKTEEIYVLGTSMSLFGMSGVRDNVYITDIPGWSSYVAGIGHPTPKPIELMEELLHKTPPGLIADPFAGSGSTLIAARNLGRRAVGVELDEAYCELAAKRLAQLTLI